MSQSPSYMQRSPLDAVAPESASTAPLVQLTRARLARWQASRFNARAVAQDGRMVVWNTLTGSINVFEARQRSVVEQLLSRVGFDGPLTKLGEYLRDRGFIVPEGIDEGRRFQQVFGQQHYRTDMLELILMASEDCNFRCVYCYEDFQRGTMRPEVREGVKRYVERRAPTLDVLSIAWFGGEPLYGFEAIADLAPFLQATAREHDLHYVCHMTTNGYLLNADTAGQLLGWDVRDFQITLDGIEEDHNRNRVGRDGSGTWRTIFNNLVALSYRDDTFKVHIRTNFDQNNSVHLREYLDVLAAEFARDERFVVSLSAVGKWGGQNDANLQVCGMDEVKHIQRQVKADARARGLNVGSGLKDVNTPGRHVCYAGRPYSILVGADGKLMKCTVALDKQANNIVGHITPEGELVLDPDNFALWVDPAWIHDKTCTSCYLVPVCQGMHCPMQRINLGHRPCPPTKSQIKAELLETLELAMPKARAVTV